MAACLDGGATATQRGFGSSALETARVGNRVASVSFPPRQGNPAISAVENGRRRGGAEKLDHWMRESVVEIVKNLGAAEAAAAPLFVHVYGDRDCSTRIRTERAVAKDWSRIKGRWGSGVEPSPEGIILVEELKDEVDLEEGSLGDSEEEQGQNGESTKAWGVLLMGKGEEGGVASYLLKTTRGGPQSQSPRGGLTCNCTHFSLVKVKSFRETTRSQLNSCWLV